MTAPIADPEQGVLGAVIVDSRVLIDVMAILDEQDFANPNHRTVWSAVLDLHRSRQPIDALTLTNHLVNEGTLAKVGGAPYLQTLMAAPPAPQSASFYAGLVKEASVRRQLAMLGTSISSSAASMDPDDLITKAKSILGDLSVSTAADSCVRFGSVSMDAMNHVEEIGTNPDANTGLPTGFIDLDRLLHGLGAGRLITVAAASSVGKSVLLGDFFRAWMMHGIPCCMVTLEMDREEVWRRQASAATRVPHHAINSGQLSEDDWSRIARWAGDVSDTPAWVCDKAKMSLAEVEALALRGHEQWGWRGYIVDYSQIVKHRSRQGTRERDVAEIAAGLKDIGRQTGMAVVTAAQINREYTKRPEGVPRLSDLRESAALEHESDVVILIHRPDAFDPESPRAGEADFIVAKNRGGAKDTVTVASQLHLQRFVDMAI